MAEHSILLCITEVQIIWDELQHISLHVTDKAAELNSISYFNDH